MRPLFDPAGRYTPAQVEAQLRSAAAAVGVRYELLDRDLNSAGDLTTVTDGRVESNGGQAIIGALDVTLEPVDELRDMAFRAHVKPWWQLRMPDGGTVEWPMGVYVWNTPARSVAPEAELWKATMGDRTHLLDVAGPGPAGFTGFADDRITDLIRRVLDRVGMPADGVADTDDELAEGKSWQFVTKRNAARRRREYLEGLWEAEQRPGPKRALARQLAEARRRAPDIESSTVSWLTILSELHDAAGFAPPWFDADGVYQARPHRDLAADDADLLLATDPDGLLVSVETQVDLTAIANRVHLRGENARNAQIGGSADANDVVPGHPLSEGVIGFFIDYADDDPVAGSPEALARRARRTLLEKLAGFETASTPSIAWPTHEPGDLIALRVDDDADLADETIWEQTRFTFELATGDMTRELRRAWRAS